MRPALSTAAALGAAILALGASVAADAPPCRYGIYKVGAVVDPTTKLTWQRAPAAKAMPWMDAASTCAHLALGGSGWRLPTMKELQTLVDETRTQPSIDPAAFPKTPPVAFWTSSPVAGSADRAWVVAFDFGASSDASVTLSARVRCVR